MHSFQPHPDSGADTASLVHSICCEQIDGDATSHVDYKHVRVWKPFPGCSHCSYPIGPKGRRCSVCYAKWKVGVVTQLLHVKCVQKNVQFFRDFSNSCNKTQLGRPVRFGKLLQCFGIFGIHGCLSQQFRTFPKGCLQERISQIEQKLQSKLQPRDVNIDAIGPQTVKKYSLR